MCIFYIQENYWRCTVCVTLSVTHNVHIHTHRHAKKKKKPCGLFVTMIEDLSQIKCMTQSLCNTYKYDFTQSRQRKLKFSAFNGGLLLYVAEEVPYIQQAEHNAHTSGLKVSLTVLNGWCRI